MIENRSRLLAALLASTVAVALAAPSFAEPARRPSDSAKEQSSEANRLPADVTTDQTVELPGRTLRFKATAGSIPINNGEGKLQAEIAYIAYVRPDGDAAGAPPHLRCSMAAPAPRPPICSSARWARGGCRSTTSRRRRRRPRSPIPTPGSISPTSCSSIRSAPATAASSTRATRCASSSGRSMATSTCSRPSCASGSRRPAGRPRRNSSRARAMAASARRSSPAKLNEQGVARQRPGHGLAGARFRLARQRPPVAARLGRAAALDGGRGARGERAVRPRSAARGRALRGGRLSAGSAARRARQRGGRAHQRARRAIDRPRSRAGAPARRTRRYPHLHARAQPRPRTDRQHV